jgi:hypothetical protein
VSLTGGKLPQGLRSSLYLAVNRTKQKHPSAKTKRPNAAKLIDHRVDWNH